MFLDLFEKFAKSDYKLRHVCPSVRTEQLGSYCHRVTTQLQLTNTSYHIENIFMKFGFSGFFENLLKKFKFC